MAYLLLTCCRMLRSCSERRCAPQPTCALSYAARVGLQANHSDPRHAPGESARVRPLLRPAAPAQGRCLLAAQAQCPHTARFSRRFSRGVILIGALFEGLRLPLLRKSGRLRQNTPDGGILTSLGQNTTFAKKPLSPKQRRYNAQNGTYEGRKGQRRYPRASCLPYKG